MIISLALLWATTTSPIEVKTTPTGVVPSEMVVKYLGEHFLPIIACESGFKQFNEDGTILMSKTHDIGIAQINIPVWGEKAKGLGYNLWVLEDNLKMAKYISEIQGDTAWVCNGIVDKKLERGI